MTIPSLPPGARAGRLRAALWRFHTLALAHRIFDGLPAPAILTRPFCGRTLFVDVARGNPQRLLWLEGERFVAERRLLRRLVRPGQSVADVGANIGYYALLFSETVGPVGRIACIEPEPDNLAELRRNVENNRLPPTDVFPVAVGASAGTVSLRAGINGSVMEDGSGEVQVPLRTLDELLADRPVDFIKIDVEGYEGHVLAGATRILNDQRPTLFVEIHPGFLAPPHTVDGLLHGLGALYPHIELWEIAPETTIPEKLRTRYLGDGVRRVPDRELLLAACRAGGREEPFWAVAPSTRNEGTRG
jgi:FkbM family methyltransferase